MPPIVENAPGLKVEQSKYGWIFRWRARNDLVRRGFPIRGLKIWQSAPEFREPSEKDKLWISERCEALQADMLAWAHGGVPVLPADYDATWATLIVQYKTDPDSPYHKKRYATRNHYDALCRRIEQDCGADRIEDTDARKLLRLHESWIRPDPEDEERKPKISMGHALFGMMRTLTSFGATLLKCKACRAIRLDLADMRIENGKPRDVALSAQQAIDHRNIVRPDFPSMALAQAFQYEGALRQKDAIGEMVPVDEKNVPLTDVVIGNEKWIRGIRWEELDRHLVLRHMTSKKNKIIVLDLHYMPMVLEELQHMYGGIERAALPSSGPIIVNEVTGFPWVAVQFRKTWRKYAGLCGIPDNVRNMDSRAGAATEADEAGVPLSSIKDLMTHSDIGMTQRYTRGSEGKVLDTMKARVAHRNKTGTEGA